MYYVYIIRCSDDSCYTGIAKDIGKRMGEHLERGSRCAKYTRSRQITSLEALWEAEDKAAAQRLEYRIKRLPRKKKLELIADPEHPERYMPVFSEGMFHYVPHATLEELPEQGPGS